MIISPPPKAANRGPVFETTFPPVKNCRNLRTRPGNLPRKPGAKSNIPHTHTHPHPEKSYWSDKTPVRPVYSSNDLSRKSADFLAQRLSPFWFIVGWSAGIVDDPSGILSVSLASFRLREDFRV